MTPKTERPLKKFIEIQELQFKLDSLKVNQRKTNSEVRSLSQKIPALIRELALK